MALTIEMGRQPTLGDGHSNRIADPLPERARGRLHAWRQAVLRMPRRLRIPLPELLQIVERQAETGEEKSRIEQHRSMPVGEHKAVAIRPIGVAGIVAKVFIEQEKGQRRQSHGRSRMAAVRLLHRVH